MTTLVIETPDRRFHRALVDVGLPEEFAEGLPEVMKWGGDIVIRRGRYLWVQATNLDSWTARELEPHTDPLPPFQPHPWMVDDILAVVPHVVLRTPDGITRKTRYRVLPGWDNEIAQVWHLRSRLGPLVVDFYAYLETMSPVIRYEMTITVHGQGEMANRTHIDIQDIHFVSGEPILIDAGTALGCGRPSNYDASQLPLDLPLDRAWVTMLSGTRRIGRCQGLLYSGHMLCTGKRGDAPLERWGAVFEAIHADSGTPQGWVNEAWDGHWGAFGAIPEYPTDLSHPSVLDDIHQARRHSRGDIYDQTPMGPAKHAGTTGAQEDHGATQDCVLANGNPLRLNEMMFSLRNFALRGCHNTTFEGIPIAAKDVPGCETWSQIPDPRNSQVLLGCPNPWPYSWPGSGYTTINGQHFSDELLTAFRRCKDSHAARRLAYDHVQMALLMVPWHPNAARARGRQLDSWGDHLILMKTEPGDTTAETLEFQEHIERQIDLYYQHWLGRDMDTPMRPIDLSTDPSLQQHRVQAVIIWQHSIFARGAYGMMQALQDYGIQPSAQSLRQLDEMIDAATDLVVRYGCGKNPDGEWHCFTSVRWDNGQDTVGDGDGSQNGVDYVVNSGVWWDWILPAFLIYLEKTPDGEHAQRAKDVVRAVRGDGPPKTQQQSEWEACVQTPIKHLLNQ